MVKPPSPTELPRFDEWTRPDEGRRPLTRDQVVRAALEVLDEGGLEDLTMRRVGDHLGVKSASLYWHVRNKEELLNLVADAICAELRPPAPTSDDWRQQFKELAREYRRVLEAHRDGALLLATTLPIGPNRLRLAELSLATLLRAGYEPQVVARAGLLFADYVTNFVVEESRAQAMTAAFPTADDSADRNPMRDWFAALPPDEFPSLIALTPHLTDPDSEERFEFGMSVLLAGLEHLED